MLLGFANNILLYNKAIDMRKQIDGLVVLVSSTLNKNPSDVVPIYFTIEFLIRLNCYIIQKEDFVYFTRGWRKVYL